MDSRAIGRTDIGFYIGIILGPLLKSLYGIHVLWSTNNIDRRSYVTSGPCVIRHPALARKSRCCLLAVERAELATQKEGALKDLL